MRVWTIRGGVASGGAQRVKKIWRELGPTRCERAAGAAETTECSSGAMNVGFMECREVARGPYRTRAAAYVRVSSTNRSSHGDGFDQNPDVQEEPIRALIAQRGWTTHRVYSDRASGAKERRPGLDALMANARRGLFDVVLVWRFDRFARSVKQPVIALEAFRSLGIEFVSHREALDTSTPMGKAMFTIIAAMAELERAIIRERVIAGLDHAQRNGTKSGKPVGRPRVIVDADTVVQLRDIEHLSWSEIGRRTRSSSGTVRRIYAIAKTRREACQNSLAGFV